MSLKTQYNAILNFISYLWVDMNTIGVQIVSVLYHIVSLSTT